MYRRMSSALLSLLLLLALLPAPAARADNQYTFEFYARFSSNPDLEGYSDFSFRAVNNPYQAGDTVTATAPVSHYLSAGYQFLEWQGLSGLTIVLDSEKFSWGKMFMKTQIFPK